jgi:hypothetical protein
MMIDYYPLLVRAVAQLEETSGAARRSIYERARVALAAQTVDFQSFDVTNHQLALEEAIRKVETESLRRTLASLGNPKLGSPKLASPKLGSPNTGLRAEFDRPIRGQQRSPGASRPLEDKRSGPTGVWGALAGRSASD